MIDKIKELIAEAEVFKAQSIERGGNISYKILR